MVVKNMPGGDALVAMNSVYNARPDGLTLSLAFWGGHMFIRVLLGEAGIEYDLTQFSYMGSFADEPYLFALASDVPAKSVNDLKQIPELVIGIADPQSGGGLSVGVAIDALGLKQPRVITGLGGADIGLGMARGEIDASAYNAATVLQWVQSGYAQSPPFVLGTERTEWAPDTPVLSEVVDLSPEQARLLKIATGGTAAKVVFGPPGIPQDRLNFLRAAFDTIMNEEGFQKQAKKLYPTLTPPISGQEFVIFAQEALTASPADVEAMFALLKPHIVIR